MFEYSHLCSRCRILVKTTSQDGAFFSVNPSAYGLSVLQKFESTSVSAQNTKCMKSEQPSWLCRGRWEAIRCHPQIVLAPETGVVYEKLPLTETQMLEAGLGRHANMLSMSTQTGGNTESQDSQTSPINVRFRLGPS
jgi:hypothetical protein